MRYLGLVLCFISGWIVGKFPDPYFWPGVLALVLANIGTTVWLHEPSQN